jgi:membrane protein DedA with SNARE-associated domain
MRVILVERQFTEWLVRYGAPMLFVAQVFGIFGLPVPDELLLTLAGALIAKGVLHGSSTITAAIAGCLTGITLSYLVGRVIGIAVLSRVFARHLAHLERAQAMFRRFGGWLLAFGYFVPGVRHVTAIAAGAGCLNYSSFAVYAYAGGTLWCTVFLALGYFAGDRWQMVARTARLHAAGWGAVVICAVVAFALAHLAIQRQRI